MKPRKVRPIFIILLLFVLIGVAAKYFAHDWMDKMIKRHTVADRLDQYGENARSRLRPYFEKSGMAYPPKRLVLVGLKKERILRIFASNATNKFHLILEYPILAASGKAGPKLKYGDCQVPEGIYPIESLNPNSSYHLSLRVGYPNDFDRKMGKLDGRDNLGGDIMIHGNSVSVGCIAIGDEASEDLFVLAADTGISNIKVILAPTDLTSKSTGFQPPTEPKWVPGLYQSIKSELEKVN